MVTMVTHLKIEKNKYLKKVGIAQNFSKKWT